MQRSICGSLALQKLHLVENFDLIENFAVINFSSKSVLHYVHYVWSQLDAFTFLFSFRACRLIWTEFQKSESPTMVYGYLFDGEKAKFGINSIDYSIMVFKGISGLYCPL